MEKNDAAGPGDYLAALMPIPRRMARRRGFRVMMSKVAEPWDPQMLDVLAGLGLAPRDETAPELLREQLNDLYRYELRRLRDRLLAGHVQKADYIGHVLELRKKYWMLSVRVDRWKHPQ